MSHAGVSLARTVDRSVGRSPLPTSFRPLAEHLAAKIRAHNSQIDEARFNRLAKIGETGATLLSYHQARRLIGCESEAVFARWVRGGKLPARRILGKWYVREADLLAFVAAREGGAR